MGSRRSESWGRHDRYREHDGRGWDNGEDRRERRREYERRHDEGRGFSADGRSEGPRPVKCYECGEVGHYKSLCPRLHGRDGKSGGTLSLSRELEESLSSVGKMAKELLDQQREAKAVRREAEARLKKEEEEKAQKEEEARVALAKEEKERKRNWELRKILAEQAEEYRLKVEKLVGLSRKLKGVSIGAKTKGKAAAKTPSSSEDTEDDENEEEATPLKDKRKRRESTRVAVNSPSVETPKKQGKQEGVDTPTSQ
ncbi:hypothetical protein CBR_g46187 [Chara braunii]|uniref:CCHC-type domain-containing protein n=1 Tax=Chara braunii TaxID=69332 RepID=A0A388LZZ2_CHABU|nr:hypothetical protein CBR_g46187 [Chara braunii]|eukprot:GBG87887.1 hypothetical protein CBR_g46187 [Chara braunii]